MVWRSRTEYARLLAITAEEAKLVMDMTVRYGTHSLYATCRSYDGLPLCSSFTGYSDETLAEVLSELMEDFDNLSERIGDLDYWRSRGYTTNPDGNPLDPQPPSGNHPLRSRSRSRSPRR